MTSHIFSGTLVAPYAGAWIEIRHREKIENPDTVAPYAGAWIEIIHSRSDGINQPGRSLRGSVD